MSEAEHIPSAGRTWTYGTCFLAATSGLVALGSLSLLTGMIVLIICRSIGLDHVYDSDGELTLFFTTAYRTFEVGLAFAVVLLLHGIVAGGHFLHRRCLPRWGWMPLVGGVAHLMY